MPAGPCKLAKSSCNTFTTSERKESFQIWLNPHVLLGHPEVLTYLTWMLVNDTSVHAEV